MEQQRRRRVVIIGAGPGGICAAIKLREAGYDDVVVLEKADGVGGTWHHNSYPGAACDVQSHLYSFSFELKRDWSRPYATQPEILAYLEHVVDAYGLAPSIRLGTAVRRATWDDQSATWRLLTEHGDEVEADAVVSAVGMFNELNWPDIAGLDAFGGTVFHSARWDHGHDLTGERVAVIGTAASAVQFVPEIAPRVGRLHVFQRAANWVGPRADASFSDEEIERFRTDPMAALQQRWKVWRTIERVITFSDPELLRLSEAAGLANLATVEDPEVRAKLTPATPFGCQRPLSSDTWYPTFNRPEVELVTDPIARVTPTGIVTADGVERRVDTIIVATGFKTTRYLSAFEVVGRGGVAIDQAWSDGARAYLGITTAGFPNLFMLYGPNTNNGSIIFMLECQVAYLVRHLQRMDAEGLDWIDVRPEVVEAYNAGLQRDLDQVSVWQAGCHNYYRGPGGRIVTQWPHTMAAYRERTTRRDDDAYASGRLAGTAAST